MYSRYKNDHFDLFKATAEVADICLNDKLIQVFNLGLQMVALAFSVDICGGDISKKAVIQTGTKFIPILIDKYCDYAFKVKDKTFEALKNILDHPFIGIGHAVDYIMNVTFPPNSVEKT